MTETEEWSSFDGVCRSTAGTHLAVSAVDPAALAKLLGSNSPTPVSGGPSAPSSSMSVSDEVKRSFDEKSRREPGCGEDRCPAGTGE